MTAIRFAGCVLTVAGMMFTGCASDQRGTAPVGAPAHSDDINSGANKNTDDLNKGSLLDHNVGPNYKINGADNTPPQ